MADVIQGDSALTSEQYARVVTRGWILILLCSALGVGIAAVSTAAITPIYTATSQVIITVEAMPNSGSAGTREAAGFARQVVNSYAGIGDTSLVLKGVVENLNLDLGEEQLGRMVRTSSPRDGVFIDATATYWDPAISARIANAVGENVAKVIMNQLRAAGDPTGSTVNATVSRQALVPTNPDSPNPKLNIALGLLLGLTIGTSLAILRVLLDKKLRSVTEIESATKLVILGEIPFDPYSKSRLIMSAPESNRVGAEAFRSLRANVLSRHVHDRVKSIVVTSSIPGEGKTTVALNLAISISETDRSVVLVDTNLRTPKIGQYSGIGAELGLTDVLTKRCTLQEALRVGAQGHPILLPSGRPISSPNDLIASTEMSDVIDELAGLFDIVLIDAPSLLGVSDAAVLSSLCDGALLVVAVADADRGELVSAVRTIERIGSRLIGVVTTTRLSGRTTVRRKARVGAADDGDCTEAAFQGRDTEPRPRNKRS